MKNCERKSWYRHYANLPCMNILDSNSSHTFRDIKRNYTMNNNKFKSWVNNIDCPSQGCNLTNSNLSESRLQLNILSFMMLIKALTPTSIFSNIVITHMLSYSRHEYSIFLCWVGKVMTCLEWQNRILYFWVEWGFPGLECHVKD